MLNSSVPAAHHRTVRLLAAGALAAALVAGVFFLHAQPDFLLSLAGQVWACF